MSLIYAFWIEPYRIEVRHLRVEDFGFREVLKGKTAVHISDLHIDKIGEREQTVLKLIEELEPDMLFLSGDYVKWEGD